MLDSKMFDEVMSEVGGVVLIRVVSHIMFELRSKITIRKCHNQKLNSS